jgi:hypothetical protein
LPSQIGRYEIRKELGNFASGATRRLDVDVGRLRGRLSLAWK